MMDATRIAKELCATIDMSHGVGVVVVYRHITAIISSNFDTSLPDNTLVPPHLSFAYKLSA